MNYPSVNHPPGTVLEQLRLGSGNFKGRTCCPESLGFEGLGEDRGLCLLKLLPA